MAYAYVSGTDWYDTANTTTVSLGGVVYATNETVFVACTYGSGTRIVESFSDGTNTYTYLGTQSDSVNGQSIAIFVIKNAVGGTYTVVFTLASAATYKGLGIRRYTGLNNSGSGTLIGNLQSNVATTANAITSTNLTPPSQPGILFSYTFESSGSGSNPSAGNGTSRGAFTNWNNFISNCMTQDQRLTATSAAAATFTASTSTNSYLTQAVFYPEPGAAGGSPLRRNSQLNGLGASGPFFHNPLG